MEYRFPSAYGYSSLNATNLLALAASIHDDPKVRRTFANYYAASAPSPITVPIGHSIRAQRPGSHAPTTPAVLIARKARVKIIRLSTREPQIIKTDEPGLLFVC